MIPVIDVGASYRELKTEIDDAIQRVLSSGWYVLGEEVENFEIQFAQYCGAKYCVGVASGLDALVLALRALEVGPGDEVIVPANTYIATWLAVSSCGADIVPVEPDPLTHCIDPAKIRDAITAKTKAIMPVHLYGHPADMKAILSIAQEHGLYVVEDAAQAHGAAIDGRRIGQHGDIIAWSFYPTKNLGAFGDAGAITTANQSLAKKISTLRNYGSQTKNINKFKGINSRLDPLQAAILSVKLPYLEKWRKRRTEIACLYHEELSDLPIALPSTARGCTHGWHLYVIRCEQREQLENILRQQGIATAVHYPIPPFRQEAYAEFHDRVASWPIADRLAQQVLSLPMCPYMDDEDVRKVTAAARQALSISNAI